MDNSTPSRSHSDLGDHGVLTFSREEIWDDGLS